MPRAAKPAASTKIYVGQSARQIQRALRIAVRACVHAATRRARESRPGARRLAWGRACVIEAFEPKLLMSSYSSSPPLIASFTATAESDTTVDLAWSASDTSGPGIAQYQLTRDGQPLGTLDASAATYDDTDLTAGVTYNYGLTAIDLDGHASAASTVSPAPSADTQPPTVPQDVTVTATTSSSVTLTWSASSDNIAVKGYNIKRNGTVVETTTDPSILTYTDTSVSANASYTYTVNAYDTATTPNQSVYSPAVAATTLPSSGVPAIDTINGQYIPPAFENYFYNDLEGVLRQAEVQTGDFGYAFDIPEYYGLGYDYVHPTSRWLDPTQPVIIQKHLLNNLPVGANLVFYDNNHNNIYDPGEPAWATTDGYSQYVSGDTLLDDVAPPSGWLSLSTPVYFVPASYSSSYTSGTYYADWESGDPVINDPYLIEGKQNVVSYYDVNGTSQWASNDPIWYDPSGNATFQYGTDSIIYDPNGLLTSGNSGKLLGKKNGLNFYDPTDSSSTEWNSSDNDLVWADSTTFQQDFANFYTQLDKVIPDFGTSVGSVLDDIRATTSSDTGTISSGTLTTSDAVHVGDYIEISSIWYPITDGGGGVLDVSGYSGSYSDTFNIIGWTLVPDTTVDGIDFTYERGQPTDTSAVFAQQFDELHDALHDALDVLGTPPDTIPTSGGLGYTPVDLTDVPSGDIPLTTEMNSRNVVPDSNLDGITNVAEDLTSFGNDTGSMAFEVDRDTPQVDIPLYTNDYGELPINGYLTQGAFAASSSDADTSPLLSTQWTGPDVSGDGTPYAYSLDTSVQNVLLINNADNHIKQVQVTRPGGNAVLFDFAWDTDTNEFSRFGLPTGINAMNTYVLVDNTPADDTDLDYSLKFADGTVQHFEVGDGLLSTISNTGTGGSVTLDDLGYGTPLDITSSGTGPTGHPNEPTGSTEPKYTTAITWQNGQIESVAYTADAGSDDASPRTITTTLDYNTDDTPGAGSNGGLIYQLLKAETTDSDSPVAINEFSYVYDEDANTIAENSNPGMGDDDPATVGTLWTRTGSVASGTVTLAVTLEDATGTSSTEYDLNNADLVTAQIVSHNDGTTTTSAETDTTYVADYTADDSGITEDSTDRYSGNEAAQWGQVATVTNPDGSWEAFTYDSDEGWVTTAVTPFQGTTIASVDGDFAGDANVNISTYSYDPMVSGGGDPVDPLAPVERPREITNTTAGVTTGITFLQYVGGTTYTRQAATDSDTWDSSTAQSSSTLNTYGPADSTSAAGGAAYDTEINDDGSETITTYNSDFSSASITHMEQTINAFGNVTASETTDEISDLETEVYAATATDAFGGVVSSASDGGSVDPDNSGGLPTDAIYSDDTWFGPDTTYDNYGNEIDYTYTGFGAVATETTHAEYITDTYTYDDAGNRISDTSDGDFSGDSGLSITTSQTFDAQGRMTSSTDALGNVTATVYSTGTDTDGTTNIATSTETAISGSTVSSATYITENYIDGSQDSVSGTSTDGETFAEGISAFTPGTDGSPGSGGLYTETISAGGAASYAYSNLLGQNYLNTQPATSGVDSSWSTFDAQGNVLSTVNFDGSTTSDMYSPIYGNVEASVTVLDGSTTADTLSVDSVTTNADSVVVNKTVTTDLTNPGTDNVTTNQWSTDGLWSQQTSGPDGTTTTQVSDLYPESGGNWTVTTTNPDGTTSDAYYNDGVLGETETWGADDATGDQVDYGYDDLAREKNNVYDTASGDTNYILRADGSVSEIQYPNGSTQQVLAWDDLNDQPAEVENPDGTYTYTDYNAKGQVIDTYGGDTAPIAESQDAATGTDTLTTYSGADLSGTAGTTTYQTNPATGLLASIQYADGSEDAYTYNSNNQLEYVNEPGFGGHETGFTYDSGGLLATADYGGGSTYTGGVSYSVNSRDSNGNITSDTQVEGSGTLTNAYTYETDGQLQSQGEAQLGSGYSVDYTYEDYGDEASPGSLSTMELLHGTTPLVETLYGYTATDDSRQLESVYNEFNGENFTYGYVSGSSMLSSLDSSSGLSTGISQDSSYRNYLWTTTNAADSTIWNQQVTYTAANQIQTSDITQATSFSGDTPTFTTRDLQYTYDTYGQLTTVTDITDPDDPIVDESYSYDAEGNRTDTGFAVNDMNQYTSIPNPLGSGTVTPTYNSRGDLTYDGKFNYTYDDEDRMLSAEAVDHYQKALYSYDAQNHLISETVLSDYSDGTYLDSSTTKFAYDGDELIAEMDSSGNLLKSYEWGIGINGKVGALLSVTDYTGESPITYDAINDASGNVVELVNSSGVVAASYTYTTVGMRYENGPAHGVCNIGDDGSYVDPVTGNTITINRIKDWLGFWTTPDPTGQQSDVNLYRVDGNDQINHSDPTGLDDVTWGPWIPTGQIIAMKKTFSWTEQRRTWTPTDTSGIFGNLRLSIYGPLTAVDRYETVTTDWQVPVSTTYDLELQFIGPRTTPDVSVGNSQGKPGRGTLSFPGVYHTITQENPGDDLLYQNRTTLIGSPAVETIYLTQVCTRRSNTGQTQTADRNVSVQIPGTIKGTLGNVYCDATGAETSLAQWIDNANAHSYDLGEDGLNIVQNGKVNHESPTSNALPNLVPMKVGVSIAIPGPSLVKKPPNNNRPAGQVDYGVTG